MSRRKKVIRIITLLSALSFLGSTGFGVIKMLTNPSQSNPVAVQTEDLSDQLQKQAKGYETVLLREPENQIALQGLVETRLQMNDLEGAIQPMETLIRLNPQQEQYKSLLATIKQQIEQKQNGKQDESDNSKMDN